MFSMKRSKNHGLDELMIFTCEAMYHDVHFGRNKIQKFSSDCWVFEKNSGSHFTFFRHGESDFEVIMATCLGGFSNDSQLRSILH